MFTRIRAIQLFFVFLVGVVFWQLFQIYPQITNLDFNPDEIAWVYDSQIYQLRKNNDPLIYSYSNDYRNSAWSSMQYRIIDQPQFGKYMYGFVLERKNISLDTENVPSLFEPENVAYSKFGYYWNQLHNKNMLEIQDEIGGVSWISAILLLRQVSFLFLLFFILLHFGFMRFLTDDYIVSILSVVILLANKIIIQNATIATMDLPALVFMYLAVVLYILASKKNIFVLFLISGMVAALAATTKLNGMFLIILPLLFFPNQNIGKLIKMISYFAAGFVSMFLLIEIAVLYDFRSLLVLFNARITQQNAFLMSYQNYNLFEYIFFLFKSFLTSFGDLLGWSLILVLLHYLYEITEKVKSFKYFFSENSYFVLVLYLLISNYFYARVGFERYLLISQTILVIIASYQLAIVRRRFQKQ